MSLPNILPLDIVREISEYIDTVYWCKRHNNFFTRFSKQDERYEILKNGIAPMTDHGDKVSMYSKIHFNGGIMYELIKNDIATVYTQDELCGVILRGCKCSRAWYYGFTKHDFEPIEYRFEKITVRELILPEKVDFEEIEYHKYILGKNVISEPISYVPEPDHEFGIYYHETNYYYNIEDIIT